MCRNLAISLLLTLWLAGTVYSKPYASIQLSATHPAPDTFLLSGYYGKDRSGTQQLVLDSSGQAQYPIDHPGIYSIYAPDSVLYEFMVADTGLYQLEFGQKVFLLTGNEYAMAYARYVQLKEKAALALQARKSADSITPSNQQALQRIQSELTATTQQLSEKYSGSFLGNCMKITAPVPIPRFEVNRDQPGADSLYRVNYQNYYYQHFFDHIAWSDSNLAFTPFLEEKLLSYFKTIQTDDARLLTERINRMFLTVPDGPLRHFIVQKTVQYYRNNKHLPVSEYVYLFCIENYYQKENTGATGPEVSAELYANDLKQLRPLSLFQTAPDFKLPNKNKQLISLSGKKSEYTVLIFWDISCEKCRQIMQEFSSAMENYSHDDIRVITVYTGNDLEIWRAMAEKKLDKEWDNLYCTSKSTIPRDYRIETLPTFYLLNQQMQIRNKHFTVPWLNAWLKENLHN